MFKLFSDIFTYRDNALRRVDPRVKLAGSLLIIITIIMSSRIWLPFAVFVVCVGGLFMLRFPVKLIIMRLAVPLGIAGVLMVLQMLMHGTTPLCSISVLGWQITVMREGFSVGLVLSSRVLGAVSVMLLLSSSTPAYQIFHALRWFRVPADWVEVAMLMYRYTFALLDLADDMSSAQRVRLGYNGLSRSVSSIGTLAGAIILRSVDQSRRTQDAMTLRGFTGQMPYCKLQPVCRADAWLFAGVTVLAALSYIAIEFGGAF